MFSLIASDLDGTLLTSDHQLGVYTTKILKQLHQHGHRLVLATGRHAIEVSYWIKQADISAFMITANGARITDDNNNTLFHCDIPSAIAREVIAFLIDEPDITVHLYDDTGWYFNKEDKHIIPYHQGTPLPRYHYTRDQLFQKTSFMKLLFCCQNIARLASYEHQLNARFGEQTTIVNSNPWCLEVMAAGINKGAALQQIIRSLNLMEQQCIAFGDGMNDVDMLTTVGKGLIMENASDRLKHQLPEHEIIGTNENEAVAAYLEKNVLLNPANITATVL